MPSVVTNTRLRVGPVIPQIARLLTNSHILGWVDQAIVSATSLLILVVLGRWAGPHELGIYAIGFSIIALLMAAQDSLITRPYSIQLHTPSGSAAEHAFSAFILAVLLSAAAAIAIAMVALLASALGTTGDTIEFVLVLAAAIPFILMREFFRRCAFAHLAVAQALAVDLCVAVPTFVVIAALGEIGRLSASNVFAALGVVCGVTGIGWLYLLRDQFSVNWTQLRPVLRRSWEMGKWFLSSQVAIQVQGYATLWITLFLAGTIAAGVYTASTTIVAFANPLLFGYFNVLLPKLALTLKKEGVVSVRRQALLAASLLAGIMGVFTLAIFVFGGAVMQLLFQGEHYSGHGELLTVLALASLAGAVGVPASLALSAAGHAREVAGITAFTVALHVTLVAVLLPVWGLLGAAYGMLLAEAVGGAGRWIAFLLYAANGVGGQATPTPDQPQSSPGSPKC